MLFGKRVENPAPPSEEALHASWTVYHDKIDMGCFAEPEKKIAALEALQTWIDKLPEGEAKEAYKYWMPNYMRTAKEDLARERIRIDGKALFTKGFPKP